MDVPFEARSCPPHQKVTAPSATPNQPHAELEGLPHRDWGSFQATSHRGEELTTSDWCACNKSVARRHIANHGALLRIGGTVQGFVSSLTSSLLELVRLPKLDISKARS
jgi:hypothetical protein